MTLVPDASVVLKWFFRARPDEPDTDLARDLLQAYIDGHHALLAPPHFLAEVCAVLAREAPSTMIENLRDLLELAIPVHDGPEVYARALQLSTLLNHHLFDTLYHAVALENEGAVLVTADERYWRVAQGQGRVVRLAQWRTIRQA